MYTFTHVNGAREGINQALKTARHLLEIAQCYRMNANLNPLVKNACEGAFVEIHYVRDMLNLMCGNEIDRSEAQVNIGKCFDILDHIDTEFAFIQTSINSPYLYTDNLSTKITVKPPSLIFAAPSK